MDSDSIVPKCEIETLSKKHYEESINVLNKQLKLSTFLLKVLERKSDIYIISPDGNISIMLEAGFTREEQEEVKAFIIDKIYKKRKDLDNELVEIQREGFSRKKISVRSKKKNSKSLKTIKDRRKARYGVKNCAVCDAQFQVHDKRAIYCSKACKTEAYRQKHGIQNPFPQSKTN